MRRMREGGAQEDLEHPSAAGRARRDAKIHHKRWNGHGRISLPREVALQPEPPPESILPSDSVSPSVSGTPAYKDRSTGLMLFGIIQIFLGSISALIGLTSLLALLARVSTGHVARPQWVWFTEIYVPAAAVFLTLGIGSVRARRWARALTLVWSWYGLALGILLTTLMTAILPVIVRTTPHAQPGSSAAPVGLLAAILTGMIVVLALFFIALPLAFVVFYGREDVKQTCARRDPVERWTDRVPLPILGTSVVFATGAVYLIGVSLATPLFPLFGRYLTGPAARVGFLLLAALDAYLAVGIFRLRKLAWWVAAIALPTRLASVVLTQIRGNRSEAYSKIGWSDSELQRLRDSPILRSHVLVWWGLFFTVAFCGYLLWIRRYFSHRQTDSEV
jgi:hypothetical protein